jgi:DNA polymerase elongation subunit (family B)
VSDCVFDIETAPLADATIPAALADKEKTKAQASGDPGAWRAFLSLWAPAASVVCVGMLNPRTHRGEVLYDDRHGRFDTIDGVEGYQTTTVGGTEAEVLEVFWKAVRAFDRVITYNGRSFDVPFLMQRSLILGVPISRNLMPPRYQPGSVHLDLADVLSQFGATRPFGLAVWTEATGGVSPKSGSVSAATVAEAFAAGRTREIAEYCMRDVIATAHLAERVQRLWSPMLEA